MDEKISKEEEKELKEIFEIGKTEEKKEVGIVFDGRQYSIRFPKKFIEEAEVNINKDIFQIKLIIPKRPEKPTISCELIRK
jgi:uncharacterized protein (DUF1015 family)